MVKSKMKLENKKWYLMVDGIAIILILATLAYTISKYSLLPEEVPIHFDFAGNADNYAAKNSIFFLTVISVFSFITAFIISVYQYRYAVAFRGAKIEEKEKYILSKGRIKLLGLTAVAAFGYMQVILVNSLMQGKVSIGFSHYLFIVVILIIEGIYKLKSKEIMKKTA